MSYLTTDLLASVQRYAAIPVSQVTFQNTDIYAFGDDSIRGKIMPLVIKTMEEFYVYPYNFSIVEGQTKYQVPYRATMASLRSVQIVSSTDPDTRVNLDKLAIEDLYAGISGNVRFLVKKNGFYMEGNNVVLYPTPTQDLDILRMNIFIRPNQLVDPSVCAQITSINTGAKQLTCATTGVPSTWTTSNLVDLIMANPGFDATAIDQVITNINSGVITFSNTLPTNVSVGDWVCLAGQSCVTQVPVELLPLLTQYIVIRILSAQRDMNALKAAIDELTVLENNASLLLAPRVQGSAKRIVNARGINRWV